MSVALREPPPPVLRRRPPSFRPAGQLRVTSGIFEVPLSESFKPGVNLHLRAAEGLRGLLACRRDEATRATEAAAQAVSVSAIRAERVAGRVVMVWAGLCLGMVLAGLPALLWLAPEGEEVPPAVAAVVAAGAVAGLVSAFALSRPDRAIP